MKLRIAIAGLVATVFGLGGAAAADLPRAPYVKAPPPPLMYNWTDWYVGLNVGGSWGHQHATLDGFGTNSQNLDGVIGGGQIGYNWQGLGSPWVFGIEADIQGSDEHNNNGALGPIAYQQKLDWFGTVRGRVGYAVGYEGRWLPYITGGLAYGENKVNGNGIILPFAVAFSGSNTNAGWTVGAGLEWAFGGQWSAKVEYLYMELNNGQTFALVPGVTNFTTGHMIDNIGRVGINYHF
jgi:outer membrane immunogenic protein